MQPSVAIEKSAWRANFTITSGCDLDREAAKECPANSANPMLWMSPLKRDSSDFLRRYRSESGLAFWIGTRLTNETLKRADKLGATSLVLPQMNGTVQVWIDGVYQKTHDFSQARVPLTLTIPKSRLRNGKDLDVALGVFPYPHQPVPERNDERAEGLFTPQAADELAQSAVFLSSGQNLIAVALFLLMGLLLGSIASTGRTRDYAVGTQIALIVALTTLFSVDLSFQVFSVATYESVFFSLLLFETMLIARFTWTILQGARTTSLQEIVAIVVVGLAPTLLNMSGWIEAHGVNLMTSWILPAVYLISACALVRRIPRATSSTRRHFLMLTFASMLATGLAYIFESYHQSGFHVIYSRWINFVMLMGLVRVFTKSHQTKTSLIEMSPSSRYHKQDPVPEEVDGWILHFEVLRFSRDRQVMSTVLSHLWTIAKLHEGEVIKTDENALIVVFTNAAQVSTGLTEIAKCIRDLETRLPIVLSTKTSIVFRAAIARGRLRPTFHQGENGLSKIPMWIDPDGKLTQLRLEASSITLPRDVSLVLTKEDLEIPSDLQRAG